MKKITCFAVMLAVLFGFVHGKKLGKLQNVFKPQMIKAYGNELFVVEGHKIHVFTIDDFKFKKTIGKQGEGPGEFKLDPSRTLVINVFKDRIIGESRYKVVYMTRSGEFLEEFRKINTVVQILPFGDFFVYYKILYGPKGKNYFALWLHDSEGKEIRELYRQKFFTFENTTFVMPDAINFCIFKDKLFWEESPDGFRIAGIDLQGKNLPVIEKPFKKIKVTEADREKNLGLFLKIPSVVRMVREKGEQFLKDYMKTVHMEYPDHFPPIRDVIADPVKNRLYVKTYLEKNNKEQYMVMDLTGKVQKTIFLPGVQPEPFLEQLQGDKKYYTIHNGTFYYLKMTLNEDEEEEWEVHAEPL